MILHGPGPTAQPWPARLGAMAFALVLAAAGATRAESACAGLVPGADAPIRNLAYAAPEAGVPAAVLKLDLWPGAAPLPAPLVVFVHGGTWMHGGKYAGTPQQARAFRAAGYAYATVNYRLLRHGPPQEAARDIAEAVAFLRREAKGCGLDPDRIILMGHSAGAHLAALVALDESYLAAAGVPPEAVRAGVLSTPTASTSPGTSGRRVTLSTPGSSAQTPPAGPPCRRSVTRAPVAVRPR